MSFLSKPISVNIGENRSIIDMIIDTPRTQGVDHKGFEVNPMVYLQLWHRSMGSGMRVFVLELLKAIDM